MATGAITPPPGFELETSSPTPPPGFELEKAAPQGTPPPAENVIRRAEGGPLNFLENLQSDIQSGTAITHLGRLLRAAGAPGTRSGVSGDTGAIVGGPAEALPRIAHGFLQTQQARVGQPSQVIPGLNEMMQGAGQLATPIVGATNPAFLPMAAGFGLAQRAGQGAASTVGAGPDTSQFVGNLTGMAALGLGPKLAEVQSPVGIRARASQAFQNVESKIGDAPINHEPVLNTAYKAMEMGAKGFQLPKTVSDFVEWAKAVQASRTPFKFSDARDFYTALGEAIPWEQYGGKGGRMYTQVMKMRAQLGDALKTTASENGLGDQYSQALKDYRTSGKIVKGAKNVGSAATLGLLGKSMGISGGDAMQFLARKMVNAGAGAPESAAGSLVRSVAPESQGMSSLDIENLTRGRYPEEQAQIQELMARAAEKPRRIGFNTTGVDPNAPPPEIMQAVRQARPDLFTTKASGTETAAGASFDNNVLNSVRSEHPEWSLSQQLQEAAIRAKRSRMR